MTKRRSRSSRRRAETLVGLRTLALKNGKPHWYAGELMEAEAAAAKYQELTGIGGGLPQGIRRS